MRLTYPLMWCLAFLEVIHNAENGTKSLIYFHIHPYWLLRLQSMIAHIGSDDLT